jgi:hypothetical protein
MAKNEMVIAYKKELMTIINDRVLKSSNRVALLVFG